MLSAIRVLVAADRVVAFAAVRTGRFADETRVNELHAGKIRITERGHDLEKVVLFGEFRGRTGGELIVDGYAFRELSYAYLTHEYGYLPIS